MSDVCATFVYFFFLTTRRFVPVKAALNRNVNIKVRTSSSFSLSACRVYLPVCASPAQAHLHEQSCSRIAAPQLSRRISLFLLEASLLSRFSLFTHTDPTDIVLLHILICFFCFFFLSPNVLQVNRIDAVKKK